MPKLCLKHAGSALERESHITDSTTMCHEISLSLRVTVAHRSGQVAATQPEPTVGPTQHERPRRRGLITRTARHDGSTVAIGIVLPFIVGRPYPQQITGDMAGQGIAEIEPADDCPTTLAQGNVKWPPTIGRKHHSPAILKAISESPTCRYIPMGIHFHRCESLATRSHSRIAAPRQAPGIIALFRNVVAQAPLN